MLYTPFNLYHIIILIAIILDVDIADTLECFSCSGTDSVDTCVTTALCPSLQSCFLNTSSAGYILGCIDNEKCGSLSHVSASLVGRDLKTEHNSAKGIQDEHGLQSKEDPTRRDAQNCFECCSSDECNKQLCDHLKPSACIDDTKVDCAWLNSRFNVCQNIHEAKLVCPKFCGLCNLVDGGWADWSAWSVCDVTCANGTLSRIRQCSNPTPVNGGLDCPGSAMEVMDCSLAACPVHGGWTQWFTWEPCSVTCDIGIQLRHRNCSNPIPQLFGDHCFGDTSESRVCTPGPCADGGWSSWGTWSDCSASCGGGIKTRHRSCSNPRPSVLGQPCEGDPNEVKTCNNNQCLTPTVAFRSKDVDLSLSSARTLVFKTTLLNIGNGYNDQTGIFTAPIAGTYSFNLQVCIVFGGNFLYYAFVQNGTSIKQGYVRGLDAAHECHDFDFLTVLNEHDRVWVYILHYSSGSLFQSDEFMNTFSGILVHI